MQRLKESGWTSWNNWEQEGSSRAAAGPLSLKSNRFKP